MMGQGSASCKQIDAQIAKTKASLTNATPQLSFAIYTSKLSEYNDGKCPLGTSTVGTEAGCKTAASTLGKTYVGHEHVHYAGMLPSGK